MTIPIIERDRQLAEVSLAPAHGFKARDAAVVGESITAVESRKALRI